MLLVFDVRQTAVPMHSMDGLSMHPIHTIHSIVHENGMKKVLTASSVGTCLWDINSSGERLVMASNSIFLFCRSVIQVFVEFSFYFRTLLL